MNYQDFEGHTPGPWMVIETKDNRDAVNINVCDSNEKVCYIYADKNDVVVQAERRANASLIAAAPDLLAENRRLREALESLESGVLTALAHTGVSDNDPHFRLTEADKILRQALLYVRRLNEQ